MGGRGSGSGRSLITIEGKSYNRSNTKWGGKTYRTIGNAKLTTIPNETRNPEISELPKNWTITSGASAPAGYLHVNNNVRFFGGNYSKRETAYLSVQKAKKYI